MTLYYQDESVTLYHGPYEDVLPALGFPTFDLIVADPPYGETALDWDRWPGGWPSMMAERATSMWCFGSMRMFLDRRDDFDKWKLSQDLIWEKSRAGLVTNRFARVHEHVLFWYQGEWRSLNLDQPRERTYGQKNKTTRPEKYHGVYGSVGSRGSSWTDDSFRAIRSVLRVGSVRQGERLGINETEKPVGLLEPLIAYGCPLGGTVLDPFAGSASTGIAARAIGRKAVLIEKRESQCEAAAKRLSQGVLDFGDVS
jgi:site-specific DNA-methyltransferase (adenine-specific)